MALFGPAIVGVAALQMLSIVRLYPAFLPDPKRFEEKFPAPPRQRRSVAGLWIRGVCVPELDEASGRIEFTDRTTLRQPETVE